jgi:hypothetical protein
MKIEIAAAILDLQATSRLQSATMRFNWPATKRMIRLHLAFFILLWWGGLNCLSGCLIPKTGAKGENHCSMSADGGACCHTQAGGEKSPSQKSIGTPSTSIRPLSCCSLLSLSGEENRNAQASDGTATSAILSRVEFTPKDDHFVKLPYRWARAPDRGGTHLLHCVFLI